MSWLHDLLGIPVGWARMPHPSMRDEDDATRWHRIWPVLENPVDGIRVAMPLCRMPDGAGACSDVMYPDLKASHLVCWAGWSGQAGLVWHVHRHNPNLGPPRLPQLVSWGSDGGVLDYLADLHGRLAVRTDHLLPYRSMSFDLQSTWNRFVNTMMLSNLEEFMHCLPSSIGAAWPVLSLEDTRHTMQAVPLACARLRAVAVLGGADTDSSLGARAAMGRRCQYVQAHRPFAQLLHEPWLRQGVDRGEGSVAMIAKAMDCTPKTVRALSSVDSSWSVQLGHFCSMPHATSLLDNLDSGAIHAIPGLDGGGWVFLMELARGLGNDLEYGAGGPSMHAQRAGLLLELDSGLREAMASIGSSLRVDHIKGTWAAEHINSWSHMRDMARAMSTELVVPCLSELEGFEDLDQAWIDDMLVPQVVHILASMGVGKLVRALDAHLADDLHPARYNPGAGRPGDGRGAGPGWNWGRAAEDMEAPNGLLIRFLSSQEELDHEGRMLGHCVAAYGHQCMQGLCVVMSLGRWTDRSNESSQSSQSNESSQSSESGGQVWQPTSSAELVVDQGGIPGPDGAPGLYVVQHRGQSNRAPDDVDRQALAWWMQCHMQGLTTFRKDYLVQARGYSTCLPAILERTLGGDWNTPPAHSWRWDRWRRILDTRARSMSVWLDTLAWQQQPMAKGLLDIRAIAAAQDRRMANLV